MTFTQEDVDNALAEGFVAGALSAREEERNRLYEALVAFEGVVIATDDVFTMINREKPIKNPFHRQFQPS